ncbi:hypothetical protein OAM01_03175 [bacterium]|nr:hypothetical protein [bacterium]
MMRLRNIFWCLILWGLASNILMRGEEMSRLISLPKLSAVEQLELVELLELQLTLERGYRSFPTNRDQERFPEGMTHKKTLKHGNDTLLFSIRSFLSQAPRLWVLATREENDQMIPNPDLHTVEEMVKSAIESIQTMRMGLRQQDLRYEIIQLSYIDVKGALEALKGFGFTVSESLGAIKWPVNIDSLPLIAPMPSPSSDQTSLIGGAAGAGAKGSFNLSVSPQMSTAIVDNANSARTDQLLVYYHNAHPEQLGRFNDILKRNIDQAAIQIFVEGLILEISEEGLKDLGIEWGFQEGNFNVVGGNLQPGGDTLQTFGFTFDNIQNFTKQWQTSIRALIEDGKAEILSRPSVLTLNNRQATIRVGTDIPIATSQEGITEGSNKISFNFNYLPTGISLNIRPRVAESRREVSMMVDTIVSSPIPGADLELKSRSGEILAAAPTIATRRVQTYARIENNTPFIIGGLVARDHVTQRKRVPILSRIPYLGKLFRSSRVTTSKREVIIVLTPHVLADRLSEEALGRFLPKDQDRFDQHSNVLFRDAYRIRAEDVFDLSFLEQNEALIVWKNRVHEWLTKNPLLGGSYPFNLFIEDRIAGEQVLVHRMIYEVLKRLSNQYSQWGNERVGYDRIIFLANKYQGRYEVNFIADLLNAGYGQKDQSLDQWFDSNPEKAMLFIYRDHGQTFVNSSLIDKTIPDIHVVECPDEETWGKLLWKYNQPDADGLKRSAILLHHPDDLERLQRAILLKQVIKLNGGTDQVSLNKFRYGKVLLIPDPNPNETHLMDREVATYFYHSEHYYAAALDQLEKAMADLESTSLELQLLSEK